jgi:hypothetical protein
VTISNVAVTFSLPYSFQCCGSGDPTTAPIEEGENSFVLPFFCSHKYHKIVNNFIINRKEFFLPKTIRIVVLLPKNLSNGIKKMGLGSGIRKKSIPDPGYRVKKGTGSRIRNTDSFCTNKVRTVYYFL